MRAASAMLSDGCPSNARSTSSPRASDCMKLGSAVSPVAPIGLTFATIRLLILLSGNRTFRGSNGEAQDISRRWCGSVRRPLRRDDDHVRRVRAFGQSGTSRSEEHTSELQSLMRISYAVFCLNKHERRTERKSTRLNSHHKCVKHIMTYA